MRHAGLLFLRRIVGKTLERSFGFGGRSGGAHRIHVLVGLETVDLDGLAIKAQALLLVGQEVLNILALVSLQLDHLSHLGVCDDGAITGKLLLDDFEDLLLVELLGQSLDGGQSLTTITLCWGLTSALRDFLKHGERGEGTARRCRTHANFGEEEDRGDTYAEYEYGCSSAEWTLLLLQHHQPPRTDRRT